MTTTEQEPQQANAPNPQAFQDSERKPWSEQEMAHLAAIYNNPANRSRNAGQVMNWKAAHQNNQADWEALFALGRNERTIRGKLYYYAGQTKSPDAKKGERTSWTQSKIELLRQYTTDPANLDVRGRVKWENFADNPKYKEIIRNHNLAQVRSAAVRHGLASKEARQDNGQFEQPRVVEHQAPVVKQFGCNFCPECGASLMGYNAAKSIQGK